MTIMNWLRKARSAVFKSLVFPLQAVIKRPDLNESVFTEDGWFETGDLGFLRNGRLTITGRTKDAIIINGINYYSHAIESAVEELPEIETSYTAACAVRVDQNSTDQLAIFFAASEKMNDEQMSQLLRNIQSHVSQVIGVTPEYLLLYKKKRFRKRLSEKYSAPS